MRTCGRESGSALEWFALFERSTALGLLAFELLMVVYVVLSAPVALAIAAALGRSGQSLTAVYLALTIVGTVAGVAARPALEMLHLSRLSVTAADPIQRTALVVAAEGLVGAFQGTAFLLSDVLGSVGGLVVAIAMLRTGVFGKATAYLRIASSVLDLGLFIPEVGRFISIGSVFAPLAWGVLVARRLFQLARRPDAAPA